MKSGKELLPDEPNIVWDEPWESGSHMQPIKFSIPPALCAARSIAHINY